MIRGVITIALITYGFLLSPPKTSDVTTAVDGAHRRIVAVVIIAAFLLYSRRVA